MEEVNPVILAIMGSVFGFLIGALKEVKIGELLMAIVTANRKCREANIKRDNILREVILVMQMSMGFLTVDNLEETRVRVIEKIEHTAQLMRELEEEERDIKPKAKPAA